MWSKFEPPLQSSIAPSSFPGRELRASRMWARWHGWPTWKENQVRWQRAQGSAGPQLRPWASPPPWPGKGLSYIHSGRPLLRVGSDGEASREKDIPLPEWRSFRGIDSGRWGPGAPLARTRPPSSRKDEVEPRGVGPWRVRCQGIAHVPLQEGCPQLEASCQLQILPVTSKVAFPSACGDGHLPPGKRLRTSSPFLQR